MGENFGKRSEQVPYSLRTVTVIVDDQTLRGSRMASLYNAE
jgi:hypothetical protein